MATRLVTGDGGIKNVYLQNVLTNRYYLQNGDGFINRQELGYVMENLGEKMEKEEIESLINEIDIDGDGQINYEEFYMMMCTK